MPYNSKITGEVLRSLRVRRRLSQEIVSGLAGMARSHLAMIESGTVNTTIATLWRIAEAMNMRLSEIILLIEDAHEKEMLTHSNEK